MTSAAPRRVMVTLSTRLLLQAVLFASGLTSAGHASAQLPAFRATPSEPGPPAELAAAGEPAPSAEATLPPPPPPPFAITEAPAPPVASSAPLPSPARNEQPSTGSAAVDREEADDMDGAPKRRWYGWQTLIADGAWLALLLGSTAVAEDGSDIGVGAALLTYEFAPGIIHFAHRNPGRGFASMGVRLGLPLAGAFIGASAASGCDDYLCEASGAGLGLLLGMGGAIAIDAAVFAYDEVEPRERSTARIMPLVSLSARGALIGLGGTL